MSNTKLSGRPIDTAKNLKPGETALVMFNEYRKLRTFSSQLSEYNIVSGRKQNVFVHAASKKTLLQVYLVAVTAEEHDAELRDDDLKGEWRKKIPLEWLNQ